MRDQLYLLLINHPLCLQQQGIQLIITNTQQTDAGKYICVCQTSDGQEFESEYELNVEMPPARNEIKPSQIEHAEAGTSVVLNCNPGRYANRYHWSRQQGHFAAETDISNVSFQSKDVIILSFNLRNLILEKNCFTERSSSRKCPS